ncbi:DUF4097 family beta strand repeat-containing protein [Marinibactrum halimedae]|uniref:DUF4097 domain-containing protein n=1 Tax=Marinibactrum halimedae TaxID=1444977 RepID=A0AA37TFR5_9GAMM|nr:DUF4097 family beta strand repeat-containing protein [Marinibactrum halimedae]MCD9459990.1 DUF4097 family beta strand repeat-containing protein [Marinibactrum halimedae]GLS28242.1 hypothetical protein GCM10007877_39610 [Marinibactrum halimedae]
MKTLILSTALSASTMIFSILAFAGEKIDKTLEAKTDGRVHIEHDFGFADIKGWDKDKVKVTGELSDLTEEFIFERRGGKIVLDIDSRKQGKWQNAPKEDGDRLEIFVPKNSEILYESTYADVTVKNIHGGAKLEITNGSIDAQDLSKSIQLNTVNGNVQLQKSEGDIAMAAVNGNLELSKSKASELSLSTVNGNVEVSIDTPKVQLDTVNGYVEITTLKTIDELRLNAVNGDIIVNTDLSKKADVSMNTVSGNIDLNLAKPVSAEIHVEGFAGGRIRNNLTDDQPEKAKYGPSRWLDLTMGEGSASVDIGTVSGTIELGYQ